MNGSMTGLLLPLLPALVQIRRSRLSASRYTCLAFQFLRQLLKGSPYRMLPPPGDRGENITRRLFYPALLLHKASRRCFADPAESLEFVQKVIYESAFSYLCATVPVLDRDFFASGAQSVRINAEALVSRFPNLKYSIKRADRSHFTFHVSLCHFVVLSRELGCPELAPVFCLADGDFFRLRQPLLEFSRPRTLARGDELCEFAFELRSNPPPAL